MTSLWVNEHIVKTMIFSTANYIVECIISTLDIEYGGIKK